MLLDDRCQGNRMILAFLEGSVGIVEVVAVEHQVNAKLVISKAIIAEYSCISCIPIGQDLIAEVGNKAVLVQSAIINPLLKITKTKSPLKGSRGILLIDCVDSRARVRLAETDAHWIVLLFVHLFRFFEPLLRGLVQRYNPNIAGWLKNKYHVYLSILAVSCHCLQLQVSWLISDVVVSILDGQITVYIVLSSLTGSNELVHYGEVLVSADGVSINVHWSIARCLPSIYILNKVSPQYCFYRSTSCLWEGSGGGQGGDCSSCGRLWCTGGLSRFSGWSSCTGGCGWGLGGGWRFGTRDTGSYKNDNIKVNPDKQCIICR